MNIRCINLTTKNSLIKGDKTSTIDTCPLWGGGYVTMKGQIKFVGFNIYTKIMYTFMYVIPNNHCAHYIIINPTKLLDNLYKFGKGVWCSKWGRR